MNKLAIALATLVSLAVVGCSQQENPISQDNGSETAIAPVISGKGGPNAGTGTIGSGTTTENPGAIFVTLPEYDRIQGSLSNTQMISATLGGTVQCKIMYFKNDVKVFSVSAVIKFPAGALDRDRNITVNLDPQTLGFVFLPHGINFAKPALLTIDTWGLDLTGFTSKNIDLWYRENGDWLESYSGRLIKIFPHNGKLMVNEMQLNHFSQYAFGRRR